MYMSGLLKIPSFNLDINSHCQVKNSMKVMTVQSKKIPINLEETLFTDELTST